MKGEKMFTFQNVYRAYRACRKNKTNTHNVLKFEQNLLENLWELTSDLQKRRYVIGRSICFLTTSPKLREVFAADFRDRIVHHLLVDALEPHYERKFIHDVYNNRKGKGTHQAVKRAEKFMNQTARGYYLQLDIKGFFYHLNKDILYRKIYAAMKEPGETGLSLQNRDNILYLTHKIIYHDPTLNYTFKGDRSKLDLLPSHKTLFKIPKYKGLPIGNLTSQFFANVYMNDFDNFVKRKLKVKRYMRYVDDFVLFDRSKQRLEELKVEIEAYILGSLGLSLRDDGRLRRHKEGLDFLGYVIRPHYTLVRQRVVKNYKQKKAKYLQEYEDQKGNMGFAEIKDFLSVQASFEGHCKHANSYNLLNKVGKINETNPFDFDRD